MKDIFGEIKSYLPKFLSPDAQKALFAELDQFPANIDSRLYSIELRKDGTIYQGDGIAELMVVNLPSAGTKPAKCLVLSNTCDVALGNKKDVPPRLSYCPVVSFAKLEKLVTEVRSATSAADFLTAVRSQKISNMFFLPKGDLLTEESVALLDQPLNCECKDADYVEYAKRKIFTLSDYGFYLFLFKLAIHFTRIADGVGRNPSAAAQA